MKGIILAGGSGTRLYPLTKVVTKQLLPIYDKPMIYYPLSTLMLSGCKDILIIHGPFDGEHFRSLLGDGSRFGINIQYKVQSEPKGLADAFIVGEKFIGNDCVSLILGDNIFYGTDFGKALNNEEFIEGGKVFAIRDKNPSQSAVVEFDKNLSVLSLEEKPEKPKSNYIVPGYYMYDNLVIEIAKNTKPSARGEIEITSVNNEYLSQGKLNVNILSRGTAWLDTGTMDDLLEASYFVKTIQTRQGVLIGSPEEVAFFKKYIDINQFRKNIEIFDKSEYGKSLSHSIEK
jgi:glucose-1-phosphate thymidylyltransferase